MGKIVENIMDDGGKLAVSSKGMGSLEQKKGANYVKDDFSWQPSRYCLEPSAPQGLVKVLWKVRVGMEQWYSQRS